MGMLLTYREGYFPDSAEAAEQSDSEPTPAPEADAYDDLTDEQVAEAYTVNVGGNATSRKGQLRALRKLDAEATPADNPPADESTADESGADSE